MISEADFPDVFPWMQARTARSKDTMGEASSCERLDKRSTFTSGATIGESGARPDRVPGTPSPGASQLPGQAQATHPAVTSAWAERARKHDAAPALTG